MRPRRYSRPFGRSDVSSDRTTAVVGDRSRRRPRGGVVANHLLLFRGGHDYNATSVSVKECRVRRKRTGGCGSHRWGMRWVITTSKRTGPRFGAVRPRATVTIRTTEIRSKNVLIFLLPEIPFDSIISLPGDMWIS
jgi:hypothetical protein